MRSQWCHADALGVRLDEGAAGGEAVGGGAGGSGEDQAVTDYGGDERIVEEQFELDGIGRRAAVEDEVV